MAGQVTQQANNSDTRFTERQASTSEATVNAKVACFPLAGRIFLTILQKKTLLQTKKSTKTSVHLKIWITKTKYNIIYN